MFECTWDANEWLCGFGVGRLRLRLSTTVPLVLSEDDTWQNLAPVTSETCATWSPSPTAVRSAEKNAATRSARAARRLRRDAVAAVAATVAATLAATAIAATVSTTAFTTGILQLVETDRRLRREWSTRAGARSKLRH